MSREGSIRRAPARTARLAAAVAIAASAFGPALSKAQGVAPPPPPPPVVTSAPGPGAPVVAPEAPGTAVVEVPAGPVLPADVQVVRFTGPPGLRVEVLGPNPEPVPVGDGRGIATGG